MSFLPMLFQLLFIWPPNNLSNVRECKKLLKTDLPDRAIKCIKDIYKKSHNPRQLRNIGFFYEKAASLSNMSLLKHFYLEKAVAAYTLYSQKNKLDRYDRVELAYRISQLRKKIPYGTISIFIQPRGTHFSLNGFRFQHLNEISPKTYLNVRPGYYILTIPLKNGRKKRYKILLRPKQIFTKFIQLSQKNALNTSPKGEHSFQNSPNTMAYLTLGISGAFLIGGIIFGVLAKNNAQQAVELSQSPTPDKYNWIEKYKQATTFAQTSNILLGTAGTLSFTSGILFLISPQLFLTSPASSPPPSSHLSPKK